MQYRKDIQILRGLAVLLVVGFHLEIPGFRSGFLGVDAFFVISGFLMAGLYNPQRIGDFFTRRARRLLPAYFATVLLTLAASAVLTRGSEFDQVRTQSLFAALAASNLGFWLENSYFDKASFKPLLHLWSLGVELQFYLLIPLLYRFVHRRPGRFALLIVASLTGCAVMVALSTKTAFFWMPLRLWEFLLGYGAFQVGQSLPIWLGSRPRLQSGLRAVALTAWLIVPWLPVDGQAVQVLSGHPGLAALTLCLATALILVLGLPQALETTQPGTALEVIGRYSYSIYLAHFPVIVLFLYRPFGGTRLKVDTPLQSLILVGLIAVASLVLHHGIENRWRSASSRPWRQGLIAWGLLALLLPGTEQIQHRLTPEAERRIDAAWTDRAPYRCGKLARITAPTARSCDLTPEVDRQAPVVYLVGNSHADSIKTTLAEVARSQNVDLRFLVENTPLMAGGMSPEGVIAEARAHQATAILLHFSAGYPSATVIERLAALGAQAGMAVAFLMPVPTWERHVPEALLDQLLHATPLPQQTAIDYARKQAALVTDLQRIGARYPLKVFDTADLLCPHDLCRVADDAGYPLYFDTGHLTLTGAAWLRPRLDQILTQWRADKAFSRSR